MARVNDQKAETEAHLESARPEYSNKEDGIVDQPSWRSWVIVAAVSFSWLAQSAYLVAAGYFLGQITEDLGGKKVSLWLPQAFQVMAAVLGPPFAAWGDALGRRWLLIFGSVCGFVGVFVMATAKSMGVAIVGSCIFGFLFANCANIFAVASEVVPRRHRSTAQICTNLGSTTGLSIGCIVGGVFIKTTGTWRPIFYISGGLLAASSLLIIAFYHPPPPPNPDRKTVIQRIVGVDALGFLFLGLFIVPLMMALIWGGGTYAWGSATIIALLTVGCVFLVVLIVHQVFFERHGLFNHDVFSQRNVYLTALGLFVEGMIFITYNVLYGEMTGLIYESDVLLSALRYSSFTLADLLFCFVYGYIAWRFRRVKEVLAWGYILFIAATIGLCTITPGSGKAVIGYAVMAGSGFSAPIALLVTVAQLAVHPDQIGLVTSLLISARSVGGAVGTAIASAVYQAKIATKLPAYVSKAASEAGLPAGSISAFTAAIVANDYTAAQAVSGSSANIVNMGRHAALEAQTSSFHYAFAVLIPFLVLALVGVLLLRPVKQQMTPLVERPLDARVERDEEDLTALEHHHRLEKIR